MKRTLDQEKQDACTCGTFLAGYALDLINRQKAEIEVLSQKRANIFEITDAFERGRKKGVQQLAERLKFEATATYKTVDGRYRYEITNDFIDTVTEEMVGADNAE